MTRISGFKVVLKNSHPDAPIEGFADYYPSTYLFELEHRRYGSIAYVLNEILLHTSVTFGFETETDINWVVQYDDLYLTLDVFFCKSWPSDVRPFGRVASKDERRRKSFPKIYPHIKSPWKIELDTEKNILTIKTDDGSRKFTLAFDKILIEKYDYGKEPKYIKYLGFNDLFKSWFPFTKGLHFLNIEWGREVLSYYNKKRVPAPRLKPAASLDQYDKYCELLIYKKTGKLSPGERLALRQRDGHGSNNVSS